MDAKVLVAFEKGFWEGLEAYSLHREQVLLREGAEATHWDNVNIAKGGRAEMKTLRRLRAEWEEHQRKVNAAKP
jgi:hypothetical protein